MIIHKELYTRHAIQCTSFTVVGIDNVYMVPTYL